MRMQRYRDSWIYPLTFTDIFSTKFRRKRTGYTSGYNKKANIRMSDKTWISSIIMMTKKPRPRYTHYIEFPDTALFTKLDVKKEGGESK